MDEWFETLYRENYAGLVRYAELLLRSKERVSASGRAEEVVQETFALAWERREELTVHVNPGGWLTNVMKNKVKEHVRQDRTWRDRMLLVSEQMKRGQHTDFMLRLDMDGLLNGREYSLLKWLYLDGYTYTELTRSTGSGKSALAMQAKRAKEKFIRNWTGP